MKEKRKQEKAITLIALVITIIVLLILAGISIATLTGENGILNKASKAEEETIEAQLKEEIELAIIEIQTEELPKQNSVTLETLAKGQLNSKLEDITARLENNKITGEYKGYNYTIDDKFKVVIGEKIKEEPIIDIKEGEYVNYVDKNGITRKSIVLYNNEDYGIQIITTNTVEDVVLGDTDFDVAKSSYNNAIEILNTKANDYLNIRYASNARCIGSMPNNSNSEIVEYYTSSESWFASYNKAFKNGDENDKEDMKQMEELGIQSINKDYWLASRIVLRRNSL